MYTTFYNLREEPFRLTSDPRFFHLAEPHSAALSTVVEAVMRRKGFIVMTGPIGTGKTTVLHAALRILTEKAAVGGPLQSAFLLNPLLTRDEFLEMILAEFEISCSTISKPARLAALQRVLLDTQRKGGTSILLVDEAHLLSSELLEEIRLLSNADTYQEKVLQIVLCGQPELLGMLNRPQLRALQQRIASSCSLRPLGFPEVRVYIAERMYAAGFHGMDYPFPTQAVEGIFRFSHGVPRLINLLCDACLNIGVKTQRPAIQMDIVEEAAAELGMNERNSFLTLEEQPSAPMSATSIKKTVQVEPSAFVSPHRVSPTEEKVLVPASAVPTPSAPEDISVPIGAAFEQPVQGRPLANFSANSAPKFQEGSTASAGMSSQAAKLIGKKDLISDAVIESAFDVLIQAMRQRRGSTLE